MRVVSLHHVNITVRDLDEAFDFYVRVLGLTMQGDGPLGVRRWLEAGSQEIHLNLGEPPDDRGQHFALEVDDLDAFVIGLKRKDIAVLGLEEMVAQGQVVVHDPSGNRIELRCRRT